jgi:hypothetical protein
MNAVDIDIEIPRSHSERRTADDHGILCSRDERSECGDIGPNSRRVAENVTVRQRTRPSRHPAGKPQDRSYPVSPTDGLSQTLELICPADATPRRIHLAELRPNGSDVSCGRARKEHLAEQNQPGAPTLKPWARSRTLGAPPIDKLLGDQARERADRASPLQCNLHLTGNNFRQAWRHRVANLVERCRRRARETDSVAERLQSCRFTDCQRPVLRRMDIPVAIARDVRGYRPAKAACWESLVFVIEDVVPVTPQLGRKL